MSNLPIESNDDALLRALSGANFGPNARIILPSGKEIDGREAQAFASAFSHDDQAPEDECLGRHTHDRYVDPANPLSSVNDDWTGDPETDRARLAARAYDSIYGYGKQKRVKNRGKLSFWRRLLSNWR